MSTVTIEEGFEPRVYDYEVIMRIEPSGIKGYSLKFNDSVDMPNIGSLVGKFRLVFSGEIDWNFGHFNNENIIESLKMVMGQEFALLFSHERNKINPRIHVGNVHVSSLDVTFYAIISGYSLYMFIKDYKDLRDGVVHITSDVSRGAKYLGNLFADRNEMKARASYVRRIDPYFEEHPYYDDEDENLNDVDNYEP